MNTLRRKIGMIRFKTILIPLLLYGYVSPSILKVPSEYTTIQKALDSASSNDTILVTSGVYKENLLWPSTKNLYMLSESGPEQTIIEAKDSGTVCGIDTSANRVTIRGFTFTKGIVGGT